MGAIQGAINQALGTVATVAAGAKHFKEQADIQKESALTTITNEADRLDEMKDDLRANAKKFAAADKDRELLHELSMAPGAIESDQDVRAFSELTKENLDDLRAAQIAGAKLRLKQEAMKMRIDRAKNRLGKKFLNTPVGGKK